MKPLWGMQFVNVDYEIAPEVTPEQFAIIMVTLRASGKAAEYERRAWYAQLPNVIYRAALKPQIDALPFNKADIPDVRVTVAQVMLGIHIGLAIYWPKPEHLGCEVNHRNLVEPDFPRWFGQRIAYHIHRKLETRQIEQTLANLDTELRDYLVRFIEGDNEDWYATYPLHQLIEAGLITPTAPYMPTDNGWLIARHLLRQA